MSRRTVGLGLATLLVSSVLLGSFMITGGGGSSGVDTGPLPEPVEPEDGDPNETEPVVNPRATPDGPISTALVDELVAAGPLSADLEIESAVDYEEADGTVIGEVKYQAPELATFIVLRQSLEGRSVPLLVIDPSGQGYEEWGGGVEAVVIAEEYFIQIVFFKDGVQTNIILNQKVRLDAPPGEVQLPVTVDELRAWAKRIAGVD